jgi:hypothetical protein
MALHTLSATLHMRLFLYLIALLTGLCTVDAAHAHNSAPVVMDAAQLMVKSAGAHHHIVVAKVTAQSTAQCAAPHFISGPVFGIDRDNDLFPSFSFATPVDRADRAHI